MTDEPPNPAATPEPRGIGTHVLKALICLGGGPLVGGFIIGFVFCDTEGAFADGIYGPFLMGAIWAWLSGMSLGFVPTSLKSFAPVVNTWLFSVPLILAVLYHEDISELWNSGRHRGSHSLVHIARVGTLGLAIAVAVWALLKMLAWFNYAGVLIIAGVIGFLVKVLVREFTTRSGR